MASFNISVPAFIMSNGRRRRTPGVGKRSSKKISPISPTPVNVSLYFEPACPPPPTPEKLATKIKPTTTRTPQPRPFQSKRDYRNSSLTCQSGCSKSLGLKIELCAMRYAGNETKLATLACLEYYGPTMVNAKYCTSVHNVRWAPVSRCLHRNHGNLAARKMVDVSALFAPRRKNIVLLRKKMSNGVPMKLKLAESLVC